MQATKCGGKATTADLKKKPKNKPSASTVSLQKALKMVLSMTSDESSILFTKYKMFYNCLKTCMITDQNPFLKQAVLQV